MVEIGYLLYNHMENIICSSYMISILYGKYYFLETKFYLRRNIYDKAHYFMAVKRRV